MNEWCPYGCHPPSKEKHELECGSLKQKHTPCGLSLCPLPNMLKPGSGLAEPRGEFTTLVYLVGLKGQEENQNHTLGHPSG